MTHQSQSDFSEYCVPGVFRVTFKTENKAFFKGSQNLLYDIGDFMVNLTDGKCENNSLLQDFQKNHIQDFSFDIVVRGKDYALEEKRIEAIKKAQREWNGEFY
jgi:hypothetical protein